MLLRHAVLELSAGSSMLALERAVTNRSAATQDYTSINNLGGWRDRGSLTALNFVVYQVFYFLECSFS